MNLKNYTSGVPSVKSISAIEHLLVEAGAEHISKTYDPASHNLVGITFQARVNGRAMSFRLPARTDRVFELMWKEVHRPRRETRDRIIDQAERTAWRLLQDWVAVQVSLIQLQQAELVEVFLPYVYDPKTEHTFFEHLRDNGFKLLIAGQSQKGEA